MRPAKVTEAFGYYNVTMAVVKLLTDPLSHRRAERIPH